MATDPGIAKRKKERLFEAAVAVLSGAPNRELNIVLLNKALFYLDLEELLETGSTATENTYLALEKGPVVAKYPQRLVKPLVASGAATQTAEADDSKPVRLISDWTTFEHLTPEQRTHAARLGQRFGGLTSKAASELSHNNPGWLLARGDGTGSPKPIDLRIALQELTEADPWMSGPDEESEAAFRDAETENGQSW